MTVPLNPQTLPDDDNVPGNPYAYCVRLNGQLFLQTGRMIAYYPAVGGPGIRFEPLTAASIGGFVASRFSAPLYTRDWVVATGAGQLLLGDRGYDINSYDLGDGNLTLRAANLLAFDSTLELKQSIVPGFLTLIGTGKFLASSSGPVIFAEPPIRVDPQALVGWAHCPAPAHHFDARWMSGFLSSAMGLLGVTSGEERQFDFTGAGTVLIQSSERGLTDPHLLRQLESQVGTLGPSVGAAAAAAGRPGAARGPATALAACPTYGSASQTKPSPGSDSRPSCTSRPPSLDSTVSNSP